MLNLIPKPRVYQEKYGEFVLNAASCVYVDEEFFHAVDVFNNMVQDACGFRPALVDTPEEAQIRFLKDVHIAEEGYRIECDKEKLYVYANTLIGALYAVESIRQITLSDLLEETKVLTMHSMFIEDEPKYRWRGVMIDDSRHFFGTDTVKTVLDMMFRFKLNVLHWHLTDNEGWRVESKKYPFLTEVGGIRKGTQVGSWLSKSIDWTPHYGYYTQGEIREIVRYAAERGIMVVPEIDMPAHFGAALAAYPELGCRGEVIDPPIRHFGKEYGPGDLIACAGKEQTYRFIYDIIDELTPLFPAPYFHIGGDEAPKTEWKTCPACRETMEQNGLKDEEELQGYFNNKIAVYLKEKGKRLIGWNEILKTEKLQNDVVVQYWTPRRDKRAESYAREGKNVIISKHQAFYFDMSYAQNPLGRTYRFRAEDWHISETAGSILGLECTLWSEWIFDEKRLEYQLFPRMHAFSEAAWTEGERDYREFKARLRRQLPILDKLGINYAPEAFWDVKPLPALHTLRKFNIDDTQYEYRRAMKRKENDSGR